MHPDLFQDIDPREIHEDLLHKYFHMEIEDIYQVHPDVPVGSEPFKELSATT